MYKSALEPLLIDLRQSDFCMWGSPTPNGQIGDVEAAVVAYCSQPGHGTRIMPAGTITGAQVSFVLIRLPHPLTPPCQ